MHNSLDFKKKRNYTILKTKENMYSWNLFVLDFVRKTPRVHKFNQEEHN